MQIDALGFHTITLGCKLNQFDSAGIEGELTRRGFRPLPAPERAAVVVINTCTVTHKADAEARKLIRAVRRRNPRCRLLVTGCYAELQAREIAAIRGVDRVFGNREKGRVGEVLDELGLTARAAPGKDAAARIPLDVDRGCEAAERLPEALHFGDRSRAFLKVQEGCRLVCSYCIIPTVRGPSRSVPPDAVVSAARSLLDGGYREIVLTGVNTGDYGLDLEPRTDLAALLRRLLAACGPNRIRLNSLEPLTISDEIIEIMAADPRLAPHVQVPLQSGSETTLRRMRRNYRLEDYLDRVTRLRRALPHAGLGADVIVGFPGETEEQFEETFDFIATSPLNYLHVFAWSPRPGTPAAELPDRVPGPAIRERSARLRGLAERLSLRFRRRFEGAELDGIILGEDRSGALRALTGNFIEVTLRGDAPTPREPARVRILRAERRETQGEITGTPPWARSRPG